MANLTTVVNGVRARPAEPAALSAWIAEIAEAHLCGATQKAVATDALAGRGGCVFCPVALKAATGRVRAPDSNQHIANRGLRLRNFAKIADVI